MESESYCIIIIFITTTTTTTTTTIYKIPKRKYCM